MRRASRRGRSAADHAWYPTRTARLIRYRASSRFGWRTGRVRYLDKPHVLAALREAAGRMAAAHDTDLAPRARSPRYRPSGLPVPADLTVCTRAELERELAAGNRFLTRILRESIPLYSRS